MYQFTNYQAPFTLMAATDSYGGGDYNNSSYNGSTSSSSSSSGSLADTGFIVLAVVTIAVVIIFLALLVRFIRKPHKPTQNPTNTTIQSPAPRQ